MLERILEITELYIDLLQKDYPKALTDNLWQAIINLRKYSDSQPRDDHGRWTDGGGSSSGGSSPKTTTNAAGKTVTIVDKITLTAEPNSITQKVNKNGGIDRNYYGADGRQYKQISNNDHNLPKLHPYGKHGEHTHDYIYDSKGNLIGRPSRDLTDKERKENGDIL